MSNNDLFLVQSLEREPPVRVALLRSSLSSIACGVDELLSSLSELSSADAKLWLFL